MSKGIPKTYDQAVKELNTILSDLEDENVSIDKLRTKVNRAKELVAYCNDKLRSIENEFDEEE